MCRDFEECVASETAIFLKGEARFFKKTLENCPPFRVLKAFFLSGDEFSCGFGGEEFSFHFHSRGKKSRAFRPAFVRFPTNEATPNEKTSERKREREREQTRERLEKKKKKKKKKKEFESSIEFIKDAKHAEEKRRGRVRKYDGGASGTETESSHRNVRATTASAGVRLRGVRAETGAGGSGSANRAFKFRLAFPAVQNN